MDKRRFLKLFLGAGAVTATGALGACVPFAPYDPYQAGPRYDYYYYPDVNVYYGISTGFYYYFFRNRWIRARRLPRHIVLVPRYRRPIFVGRPRPYRFNREHRRRYPIRNRPRVGPRSTRTPRATRTPRRDRPRRAARTRREIELEQRELRRQRRQNRRSGGVRRRGG